jgi:diketogulonate reductase-like aldo/keto reductase
MAAPHRPHCNRRDFVRTLAASAVAAGTLPVLLGGEAPPPAKRSAVDRVPLGKTKVQPSRLAFGTGSNGGKVQRDLGQEGFTRLVRHAYDSGIRFFDTADEYKIHTMVGQALKGLPRDQYVLMTKMEWETSPDVFKELDRFRTELGVDYFDICLIHCVREPGWHAKLEKMRDGLSAAKDKGLVRAIGTSNHGLPGLREVATSNWVEVHLTRVNHNGRHMDGATGKWAEPSDAAAAWAEVKKISESGKAVLGMKLVGNGEFKNADDREKAIQTVMKCPEISAVTMGFKSPAEIDEAIERINRALTA